MLKNNRPSDIWCFFFLVFSLWPLEGYGQQLNILIDAEMKGESPDSTPHLIEGRMVIQDDFLQIKERCLYLPYNDPNPGRSLASSNLLKGFSPNGIKQDPMDSAISLVEFDESPHLITKISSFLYKISYQNIKPLSLKFSSRLADHRTARGEIMFDGFHPVPLTSCPDTKSPSSFLLQRAFAEYKTNLALPEGWSGIEPFARTSSAARQGATPFRTIRWVVGATKNHLTHAFQFEGLSIEMRYLTPEFLNLKQTIKDSLAACRNWLGEYPFPILYIIETGGLHSSDMPGIITLNKPRQKAFEKLQNTVLNWDHWASVMLLVNQWYGTSISPKAPQDEWFFIGLNNFIAAKALKNQSNRHNLFNSYDLGQSVISVDFREAQNIAASVLSREDPKAVLTDQNLQSSIPLGQQHHFLFARHTQALHHLLQITGEILEVLHPKKHV
jgi:hypothetical protein